ncbi:MAG: ribonuclease HII [Thermoplasmata archaeon]|nr:MAG: ribonuclease HII [Thermoplasmata archaeon]
MICGIDEAGRGPVIGPMVVAGVWIKEGENDVLKKMAIKDSKKHTKKQREKHAKKIREMFFHSFIIISPEDIDALRSTMSMNELEIHLFATLGKKREADIYYIDSADVDEKRFGEEFKKNLGFKAEIISKHDADNLFPVVSAASIIAKVERDAEMEKIANMLQKKLDIPIGSGYPSDEKTRLFIKKWIEKFGDVPPYTRRSWKTVKKLTAEVKQKKLF